MSTPLAQRVVPFPGARRDKTGGVLPREHAILEQLTVGIFHATSDGRLLGANPAFWRLLGLEPPKAAQDLALHHVWAHAEEGSDVLQRLGAEGVQRHELEIRRADGSRFWAVVTGSPYPAPTGENEILGSIEDATEQRRTRDALTRLSATTGDDFLHGLVKHVAQAMGVACAFVGRLNPGVPESLTMQAVWGDVGLEEGFTYGLSNTPCQRVLAEELCCFPEKVAELFPEDEILVRMRAESYIGTPLFFEGRTIGLLSAIDSRPLQAPLQAGSVLRLFAARAGAELARQQEVRAFRERAAFLQHTLDSLRHPFYVIEVGDHRITTANAAAGFGALRSDARCYMVSHGRTEPCSGREHPCPIGEIRRTRKPTMVEHTHLGPAGRARVYEVHAHPIFDEKGELKQIIEYNLDVTERKEAETALQASETRFRHLYENSPLMMYSVDEGGRICDANHKFAEETGYSREDIIGKKVDLLGTEAAAREAIALLTPQFWRRGYARDIPYQLLRKDGTVMQAVLGCVATATPAGTRINISVVRDVTEQKRAEEAARRSEERYVLAASGANDGLWDWDLRSNRIDFSPRWKAMLGYAPGELRDDPAEWLDRIHPDDVDRVRVALTLHRDGLNWEFADEHRVLQKDGRFRWVMTRGVCVRDAQGQAYRMAGSMADISERKRVEERLRHQSLHDNLTDLPNRALFMDRLSRSIERCRRTPTYHFALLLVDLDRFKVVNDGLGHSVGDRLLVAVAQRIRACLYSRDTIGRFGGDEFVILLEEIKDASGAVRVAERIATALGLPFDVGDQEVFSTASIGIALSRTSGCTAEDLLREGDTAMHRAKAQGGARHAVFDEAMHGRALTRLQLETDLRRALVAQQFRLVYQPIVELGTEAICGYEALARWHHPTRGVLRPTEFIKALEDTALIRPFGTWSLGEACTQASTWVAQAPAAAPWLSLNLSCKQLLEPDLIERTQEVLASSGLDAARLRLEITESALMEDPDSAAATLRALHDLGVRIYIDDFGTGYSSLSYLQRLSVDALKIPGQFVKSLEDDRGSLEITRTIIALADRLGISVIAEGIETPGQQASLISLGCRYGQGWLISDAVEPSLLHS